MHQPEFLSWLHQQIPLTAAMQIDRVEFDGQQLSLYAPLTPNLNDKGTGFAGATSGLATLSGWCLITLWLRSRGIDADVMIARSEVEYVAPVNQDLISQVALPDTDQMQAFEARLKGRGRARLPLTVTLGEADAPELKLNGDYAVKIR